jgi:hypothetical protein
MAQEIDANYEVHQKTWHNFVRLTIYTTIGVIVLLVLMALFLL